MEQINYTSFLSSITNFSSNKQMKFIFFYNMLNACCGIPWYLVFQKLTNSAHNLVNSIRSLAHHLFLLALYCSHLFHFSCMLVFH